MFKRLLIASVLLLPNVALAQYPGDDDYDYEYNYDAYGDDDLIHVNKKFLTPAERGQVATIQARAEKREEQQLARELAKAKEASEREAARQQQCTIPFLWIGCPAKAGS